jgi:hypothetical protein
MQVQMYRVILASRRVTQQLLEVLSPASGINTLNTVYIPQYAQSVGTRTRLASTWCPAVSDLLCETDSRYSYTHEATTHDAACSRNRRQGGTIASLGTLMPYDTASSNKHSHGTQRCDLAVDGASLLHPSPRLPIASLTGPDDPCQG